MQLAMAKLQDSSRHLEDSAKLAEILSDKGYLFLRGALGRKKVEKVSRDIIGTLKRHGFVDLNASEAVWSGRMPKDNELSLGYGGAVKSINNLSSIRELILRGGQVDLLKRLLDSQVFSWVENRDRGIRIMLPGRLSYASVGGVKGTNVTPAHQDYYFFRTPNYYTTWIPLMDIDESVGGLAIAEDSHRSGFYEHWYRGSEFLGVPENREESKSWSASKASPATGDVKAESIPKTWLNADYQCGDLLMFHPMVLHRGLVNTSNKIRLSADIRYQQKGAPTIWRARHRFTYSKKVETEIRETVGSLALEPGLALKVIDRLYVEGPAGGKGGDLRARAEAAAREITSTGRE